MELDIVKLLQYFWFCDQLLLLSYVMVVPFVRLSAGWSRSYNQITSFPKIGGVGALPYSISLTKDPGCKNFYDLGTSSVTFDETLHAAPKWRENDMLVRKDIAV